MISKTRLGVSTHELVTGDGSNAKDTSVICKTPAGGCQSSEWSLPCCQPGEVVTDNSATS